jgi:hypothetical protein
MAIIPKRFEVGVIRPKSGQGSDGPRPPPPYPIGVGAGRGGNGGGMAQHATSIWRHKMQGSGKNWRVWFFSIWRHKMQGSGKNWRVWFFIEFLKWHTVELSNDQVNAAGPNPSLSPKDILAVFANMDGGIEEMKRWCETQTKKRWTYIPAARFVFASKKDAALFKLWWS